MICLKLLILTVGLSLAFASKLNPFCSPMVNFSQGIVVVKLGQSLIELLYTVAISMRLRDMTCNSLSDQRALNYTAEKLVIKGRNPCLRVLGTNQVHYSQFKG